MSTSPFMTRLPAPDAKFKIPAISMLLTVTTVLGLIVIVLPLMIFTVSLLTGMTPPAQLVVEFQFPPVGVEVMVAEFAWMFPSSSRMIVNNLHVFFIVILLACGQLLIP
ncbi:hypothetical protein D3C87_1396580 [compost metagenome]